MLNGGGTWQPNGATLGLDPWSQSVTTKLYAASQCLRKTPKSLASVRD